MIEIMSFGGGVQTVAMALMCINKDLPMPDCAIFADRGWELEETYIYLSWFIPYCEENGLKFHIVSKGNLRKDALDTNKRWASMPLFTLDENGSRGVIRRQCTNDYKIQPVYYKVRYLMGLNPYQRTKNPSNIWLGISIDEASRMKPSRVGFANNKYPLIEHNLSRQNCLSYIESKGFYIPPKSACVGCPYHSNEFWQMLKRDYPIEFKNACEFDEQIRFNPRRGIKNPMYLHRYCKPLKDIDFTQGQIDLFQEECEGYCGL